MAIWELCFPKNIIDLIVIHTDSKIKGETADARAKKRENVTYKQKTTGLEIRALIGSFYIAKSLCQDHTDMRDLYNTIYGIPHFLATMTENHLIFLISCLHFNNKPERKENNKTDPLTAIRVVFDHLIETFKELYVLTDTHTTDEQVLPFCGWCPFRVYLPTKPDCYGIKIDMLCETKTSYMMNSLSKKVNHYF